jgi:environmental stress-induced protein Ves
MKATVVRLADAALQPWRNGGGVTRELLAWPHPDDWRVRISVADIAADGPFSTFPGVQRWFTVLQGGGVALSIDGVEQVCRVGDAPVAFSGEASSACRLLAGPSRDLNFMLRGVDGAMQRVVANRSRAPRASSSGVFTMAAGRCRVAGSVIELAAESLLWLDDAGEALTFEPDDDAAQNPAWWMTVGEAGTPS